MERALLAVLLSRVNEVVTTSALTEALWRDRPPRAVGNALQTIVHRLRRRLSDPRRVVYQRPGYTLVAQSGEVDVLRFERMIAEARQTRETGNLADAVSAYRDGLKLWRGDPYDDFPDIPLLYTEIARLRERRLTVIEEMIDVELRLGNHADVAAQLPSLIAENPLREVFYAQLMRAFYGCQRQADALQVYQDARRALGEIGLDPGAQLQELEIAILRGTVSAVAIPAQLPATAAAFTGRGDHLRQLDELLDQDTETTHLPISVITGTAGVGKTTLALHWAHRVRNRFPDGQLYIDLHGCSSVREPEPDVVLGQFLRALGVATERVPAHLAEAAAMYRSIVAAKRLLIVLDNASHPDQVRHLLPASPHCVVLVTSRDRMTGLVARDGARRLAVNLLPPADSVALLTKLLGEGNGIHELAELCAHLPLALRIAAANVTNSAHRTVFDYVQTLKHGDRLAALRSDEDGGAAVRSAFDLSFVRLNPVQKHAFRSLGLVRGPDFTAQTLAALADLTVPEAAELLDQLSCKHLIEQRAPGRYVFHDLLRLYAIDRARQHGSWQEDFSHQEP